MKTLIILMLLCLTHTVWADAYLGCGVSSLRQGALARDFLKQDHEHFLTLNCHLRNEPAIEKSGFLAWQESQPSQLAHSRASQWRKAELSWPFWRQNDFFFSLEWGSDHFSTELPLKQDVHWQASGNMLLAGQDIDFTQQENYLGLKAQLAYQQLPVTFLSLRRKSSLLSVAINESAKSWLNRINSNSWQVQLGCIPPDFGLVWAWSLTSEAGEISKLTHPVSSRLNTEQYVGIDLFLALLWRWRLNNSLHPYLKISGETRFWYFDEGATTQNSLGSLWQHSYATEAGLEWRF
jgi:hypothetical protein